MIFPQKIIDLDANASTRLAPEVLAKMQQTAQSLWGNPSSANCLGELAAQEIEEARQSVANLISAEKDEIIFTSGATESINLAIQGFCRSQTKRNIHIVTSNVEHKAVLETLNHIKMQDGIDVTCVKADRQAHISAETIGAQLKDETALVCIIAGNNEVGTLTRLNEICSIVKKNSSALIFVDAAQMGAYYPPNIKKCPIDLLALSSHKMYGPKGVGALFVRKGVSIVPLMFGGSHERGLRPGTINTPGIAGFGVAAQLARENSEKQNKKLINLRHSFLQALLSEVPDAKLNGDPEYRLPGNISLTIPFIEARVLLKKLPHIALSQGSACSSSTQQPSHVLKAIGLSPAEIQWTIRVALSWFTTIEDTETSVFDIIKACKELRG